MERALTPVAVAGVRPGATMRAVSDQAEPTPRSGERTLQRARELRAAAVAAADDGELTRSAEILRDGLAVLGLDELGDPAGASELGARAGASELAPEERDRMGAAILLSLALPTYELGDLQAGLACLDAAAGVAARAGAFELSALIHCQRGVVLLRAGQPRRALAELDAAVRLLDRAGPLEQCKIMMNRGDAHHALGQIRQARADFTVALAIARAENLAEFVFRNTHNVAYMDYLAGDLPLALSLMPSIGEATSHYARGVVGMDRAKVLLSAGLLSEADATLAQACDALARTDLVQLLAEAELARAETALMAKGYARARDLAQQAATRFRERGNARLTDLADLVVLRARAGLLADPADLVGPLADLADRLAAEDLPDQARTARLLELEASLESTKRPPDVDVTVRAGEPINLRLQVRFTRARLAFARFDERAARREIRRGLAELADYQARFGSIDLQTSSAAHGAELAALAVTADLEADRPASVLSWLERVRAITTHVPDVRPPRDEVAANLLSQLRAVVRQLELDRAEGRPVAELNRQRAGLERRIRAHSWTQHGHRVAARLPGAGELRAALGDAVLLAVFGVNEEIHGLVLSRHGCWTRRLTTMAEAERLSRRISADFDVLALDHVPEPLRRSARQSLEHDCRFLDDLLLAPLGLPDGPVVLLPPGRLAGLAWAQLPGLRGRPVTVAPSGAAWLAAHAGAAAVRRADRVVAVAGPGLHRAEQEVARVAAAWPGGLTLTGPQATGEAFLAAVDGARLVHVAAHGQHQAESPLFSSLLLADGQVVGYDLDRLAVPPLQVVLSACDVGRGSVRPGEESLGLTRALLHSGTATVISGVAKVSDARAAEVMVAYHQRLAGGAAPAHALAEVLAAADEPLPFACFGAGW